MDIYIYIYIYIFEKLPGNTLILSKNSGNFFSESSNNPAGREQRTGLKT